MQMIANGQIESEPLFYFHSAKICLNGCRDTFMKITSLHGYSFFGIK